MLEGLLCLDPAKRLSAKAALNHEVGACVPACLRACVRAAEWFVGKRIYLVAPGSNTDIQFFREPPAMTSPETFPRLPARRFH